MCATHSPGTNLLETRETLCLLRQTDASALLEFAVALPLLVVMVGRDSSTLAGRST